MNPYRVAIIASPGYGADLIRLADFMHVWVIDTPEYRDQVKDIWSRGSGYSPYVGATPFGYDAGSPPDAVVSDILDTVNDHHGSSWTEESGTLPGWNEIHVYGAEATDALIEVFREYGITEIEQTGFGFIGTESRDEEEQKDSDDSTEPGISRPECISSVNTSGVILPRDTER